MENKKGINFFLAFIAILLGWTLFKHFDFQTFRFADPVLDFLYLLVLVICVYLVIKGTKKGTDK